MPSKSKPQQNLMRGVAHDPEFAKKMGIPQSVGRDYVNADKKMGVRFKHGGVHSYAEGGESGKGMKPMLPGSKIMQTQDPDALARFRAWRSEPGNMWEAIRPRQIDDTLHQREEPDVSDTYRYGGITRSTGRFAVGGPVLPRSGSRGRK
jgi:hypothetical protein